MRQLNYYNISNDINEFGQIEDDVNNEMTEMLGEFDFIYEGWQVFRERCQMKRWYFTDRTQTNTLTFDVARTKRVKKQAKTYKYASANYNPLRIFL